MRVDERGIQEALAILAKTVEALLRVSEQASEGSRQTARRGC